MVWLGVLCANASVGYIGIYFLMYSCSFLLHACICIITAQLRIVLSCLQMRDVIEDNLLVIDFGFPVFSCLYIYECCYDKSNIITQGCYLSVLFLNFCCAKISAICLLCMMNDWNLLYSYTFHVLDAS